MTHQKLFGDFLIERNLLNQEQLLDALIEQGKDQRSTAEIVYERNLLDRLSQLNILRIQNQEMCSYQQACEMMGLWTRDLQAGITAAADADRRPLGQILLKKTALTFSELAQALDEYLKTRLHDSTIATTPLTSQPVKAIIKPSLTSPVPVNLDHAPPIESLLLVEFLSVIHDSKLERIETNIEALKDCVANNNTEATWDAIRETLTLELQVMKEAARFVRAQLVENTLCTVEIATSVTSWPVAMAATAQSLSLFESVKSAMVHIRNIRSHLVVDGLEKDYWNEDSNQELYQSLITDILKKVHAIENSAHQLGVLQCLST